MAIGSWLIANGHAPRELELCAVFLAAVIIAFS
jgi:hypothetical protein